MTFASSEMEQVEATSRTLLGDGSWMDWWLMVAHSMMILDSLSESKCHHLFLAGTRTIMMISRMASVMWANSILKR